MRDWTRLDMECAEIDEMERRYARQRLRCLLDGQAPVASEEAEEGAPVAPLPEAETERRRTLTDAELLAELELHAEYGQ